LNDAARKRLITRNPALDVDPPRVGRQQAPSLQTWSAEDLRAFLRSVDGDRLGVLWRVMATTGLRRGEAAALRWGDLDLEAETLRVERNRVAVGYSEVIEGAPKSAKGRRTIPLASGTVTALRKWSSQQKAERLQWGPAWTDSGYVFTREDGTPWHPDRITKLFDGAVRKAGVPRIRLHDLRHTFATLLFAANEHPKTVQELLGHSTISVTLDTYTHARPETLASATARLGAIIEGQA
jgi:integrase